MGRAVAQVQNAPHEAAVSSHRALQARTDRPGRCSARKAVKFYRSRIAYWERKMGAGPSRAVPRGFDSQPCPRYLARVLRTKAHASRLRYERWRESRDYQWDYQTWMPGWMIRLGQCEMGLDWSRRWASYEGAFAFHTGTWDRYRLPTHPPRAWMATPRQQMEVVYRVARSVTVGSAWGCWRGPQHAWVRGGLPEYSFRG